MFDIHSLGHTEEKCSSSLLVCSSRHYKSLVMPLHAVLFQHFLPKSGLAGWANIKWKNAKVSAFQMNYIVRHPGRRKGAVLIEPFGNTNFRPNYEIIYAVT